MPDPSYEVYWKRGRFIISYSDDKEKEKDKVLKRPKIWTFASNRAFSLERESFGKRYAISKDIKHDIQARPDQHCSTMGLL